MKGNRAATRFGKIVRQMRQGRDWTQLDLASELNVDCAYVSRIELGKKNVSLETMIKLAKVFDVKMSFGNTRL